jgi:hypothetical protein
MDKTIELFRFHPMTLGNAPVDPDMIAWVLEMMLSYGRGIDRSQVAANEPYWVVDENVRRAPGHDS